MSAPARRLLKLHALAPSHLPAHETLAPAQQSTSVVQLAPFITTLLQEGRALIDETVPSSFTHVKTAKYSASEGGNVDALAGGASVDSARENGGRGEYWFARRSRHEAGDEVGRATWEEFEEALYREHSVREGEYTPDIFDARKLCEWDVGGAMEGWKDVGLCIYEMVHNLGFPMSHRCFSTLVITARDTPSSFLVVQIPVDLSAVPAALYSTGKNRTEGTGTQQKKRVVIGQYVSVERCRRSDEGGVTKVQWDMATASDARGWLPMAVQKMALPKVIAKDVGFVMKWVQSKRGRNVPKATSGGATS